MNRRFLLMVFILTCCKILFSQENSTYCTKRNKQHSKIKSNALTISQIAETEKYNVNYYKLDLNLINTSTFLSGKVRMDATARIYVDSALIELFQTFNISNIRVNGNPVSYSRVKSAIKVPIFKNAGENFTIETEYSGLPPSSATNPLGGSGMSYKKSPSWGNHVVWSLSEPFSAYEWFPVKQSLKDKIDSSDVSITVPDTCMAGSNGKLVSVDTLGNGYLRFNWKNRHAIDYYLISVAVARYVEYNIYAHPVGINDSILIQNFIYNNPQTLAAFKTEIDKTVPFLELFSNYYGLYPFASEKYGHCMAPISGGMEHQTMTTQGFFEKKLTAHELAHQWWGNNITCSSWSDIWINEGWASYSEYIMLENLYPAEKVGHMNTVHNNIMKQPNGSVWCLDSLNEGRIFDSRLTYDKGAAIIHTLRYIMNNDSLFFSITREFQNKFSDSVASGNEFKKFLENKTGINFNLFFEQWYYGEGFPKYTLKWKQDNSDLLINIQHTTSTNTITPLFSTPLEIKFKRQFQSDTTIRFNINSNNDFFTITNIGQITSNISIDPSNYIVNQVTSIQQDNNLEITENPNTANAFVFPNPSNGSFRIANLNQNSEINIYSLNGVLIFNTEISPNEIVTTKNLDQGNYILEIKQGNLRTGIKLISIE